MKIGKKTTGLALIALCSFLASPYLFGQMQQTLVSPPINGDNSGLVNQNNSPSAFVGPQPGPALSGVDNYVNQNEQLNLDANAGNTRVLRTNQKALLNDFVTATFELKNVDPREIRNAIRTICGLEGGRAEEIIDSKTKQNFLQVICPKFQLPYLTKALAALDQKWVAEENTGSVTFYYKALNRSAGEVDFIASNYGSDATQTGAFSVVDTTNNAVARLETPYRSDQYMKAAKEIDIPANQVLLDVKIVEVNSGNDLKIGLDYINWKNGPGRNLFEFVYQGAIAESHNRSLTSPFDPFRTGGDAAGAHSRQELEDQYHQIYAAANYLLTSNYIDFLQVKGQARVLTKQSLMVESSQTASLNAEDAIVALVSTPGDVDTVGPDTQQGIGANIIGSRNTKRPVTTVPVALRDSNRRLNNRPAGSTGVFLSLTPFVGLESMELVLSVSNADLNGLAPNGQPIINTRDLTTTVRLLDGQPYVVSGLKRKHNVRETAKAPGLGSLPVLGYLFGGETTINREDDVLIVVTPHFYLPSQAVIHTPPQVKEVAGIVQGRVIKPLPANPYGYDQWLLDKTN
jgi:Flp pilus assembly secretin CpaC